MSYKNRGILADKESFLADDYLSNYPDICGDEFLTGEITTIPRGGMPDYHITWAAKEGVKVEHTRMRVAKNSVALNKRLVAARHLYDSKHPDQLYPQLNNKQAKHKKSVTAKKSKQKKKQAVNPSHAGRVKLTEVRMSPTTTPVVTSQTVHVLPNTLYREDSISDDGSEVMGGIHIMILQKILRMI